VTAAAGARALAPGWLVNLIRGQCDLLGFYDTDEGRLGDAWPRELLIGGSVPVAGERAHEEVARVDAQRHGEAVNVAQADVLATFQPTEVLAAHIEPFGHGLLRQAERTAVRAGVHRTAA